MLNQVTLIGRISNEIELRYTPNGIATSRFNLAVERLYQQNGEKKVDFIDIVCWRKLAEVVANNLDKGRLVCVTGALQIRSYDDKDGIRRKAAEIVAENVRFLDYPKDKESSSNEEHDFGSEIDPADIPFK